MSDGGDAALSGDDGVADGRYRALADAVDAGVCRIDADGRFVAVDDAAVETTGYDRAELLGEPVSLVLSDEDAARLERAVRDRREAEATGNARRDAGAERDPRRGTKLAGDDAIDLTARTANGEAVPLEFRFGIVDGGGEFDGIVATLREAGESDRRPEGDAPIGELDGSIATVLDEADVGIFLLDEAFEVAWIDETAERFFGVDRADVVGRDKRRVIEETIRDRLADPDEFAETVLATYEDNSYVERFECRVTAGEDRAERWLEHRSKPIESGRYAGGRVELYYDVSDRKRSERERLEGEQRYRSLVEAVEEYAIFMLDPDGCVVTWNEGAARIKGYEREEIVGEHFSTFYTDADADDGVPERNLEEATAGGSVEDEGWRIRSDGSRFWANVTITAVRDDDDGSLQGYAKVTRDMTDRREREQLLRRERLLERYQAYTDDILDAIDDVFYVVTANGSLKRWNESVCEVSGYSEVEVAGMDALDFFPEDEQGTIADAIARGFETGDVRVEAQLRTKDGERIPYEFVASALEDPEGNPVLAGIGRDVSQRDRREAELERRAREQRTIAELGQFALETNDLDELMDEASRQVAAVLDNAYCKVLDLDPDDRELLLRQGVGWDDGIVGIATVDADADSQAGHTLRSEEPVVVDDLESETRFSGPDLLTSHDVVSGVSTIVGSVDEPWGILGTHDTERRTFTEEDVNFVQGVANILADAIERRAYREELERTIQRLEASNERLEQFAYAASHDLQEPLRMVSSYLRLIERRAGDELSAETREFFEYAVNGAERMRAMIDGLLEYSRVESGRDPLEPVELDDVLDDVRADLRLRIDESGAEIAAEPLPRIVGDAGQLHQVFQNLLDNAIEYSGDEPPRISVAAERAGDEWVISVSDEGIGIDPDDQVRIFDVFQRLHARGEHDGTGIGLALCERIVERHGGEIRVDSEPGEGTTFSFTLPAAGGRDG